MRFTCLTSLALFFGALSPAQQTDAPITVLTVRSTLVQVPALVKDKAHQVVFKLSADDFLLTDDGVPQNLILDSGTDSQPLALAIVVETGGAGAGHLGDYQEIDAALAAFVGGVERRIAVIGFDSTPHLLRPFTPNIGDAFKQLANLHKGDTGAAILDAVAFAVDQLKAQPASYRRAILLLSETIDHGSKTSLTDALRLITDTNTTIYSFGFSSTGAAISHEASKLNSSEAGPAHGCFSKEGADVEYEGHYSKQVLDCISQLAPPVRIATMAFLAARNALRTNASESVAKLTGGEFNHFRDTKDLKAGLISVSNDVPNYYILSFSPTSLKPGLHVLKLQVKDRPELTLRSRSEYWIDGDTGR
jgi:VWFA-related protein